MNPFIATITSTDPEVRHRPFDALVQGLSTPALLQACEELEAGRHALPTLYARVRAALFLYAAYRFHLQDAPDLPVTGVIPYAGVQDVQGRRFEQAIARFRQAQREQGANAALCSALADAYHRLAFRILADQVRHSIRASVGNRWMFRIGHADDHPVRLHPALLQRTAGSPLYPILAEATPVRLDLSHSGWSDIFFLGMDYPEGARVLNISVDLGIDGCDAAPQPPIACYVRAIPEPVLRLTSIDLQTTKDLTDLRELFNFGNDYLSLLKAGVVASGLIPPAFEDTGQPLAQVLGRIAGPGMGLELVTSVRDIPKGSRLAVSTNLLASIISALMRATGQTAALEGELSEPERRLVASRAILGEWLGGSGGGWQDSGGIWPGIKVIEGVPAGDGDPEYGVSAGCLLPRHRLLGDDALHPEIAERLAASLVLVHGGLAQNVGPILEMVTEKYLLRCGAEWQARHEMRAIFDGMLQALRMGDVCALGRLTTQHWDGPLQTIIPWVTNRFTETVIGRTRARFGDDFWGFLMLGGMSGGGMGLFTAPERATAFRREVHAIMGEAKDELAQALPFAMDPVVYTFAINRHGTTACLLHGTDALMPNGYYSLQVPALVRRPEALPPLRRTELEQVTARCMQPGEAHALLRSVVGNLFPVSASAAHGATSAADMETERIKQAHGFDPLLHEAMRADLRAGRIGLAHNRLPVDTEVRDVEPDDVIHLDPHGSARMAGERALRDGRVAVLTLAAGVGSRWTGGAGVIKALHPFARLGGTHRTFLDVHLAKARRAAALYGTAAPHVIATSYLTHGPIEAYLTREAPDGGWLLSPGRAIGQRLIPMVRDLQFLWEELPQELLDEQKQKVREAERAALCDWARSMGEGDDYTDNVPLQRLCPPGHWYEVPNLLRNGVLARLLAEHPRVDALLLHNVDTLGADLDPAALGAHLICGRALTVEVIPRHLTDRGGGLARVNGRVRLLEGLAQPREEDEFRLRYYNTMTTWIQIDALLAAFGLTRADLTGPEERLTEAVRRLAQRLPTYVTIKEAKRRWGHGQEEVFPVAQFEKLWGDMTALPDLACGYLVVPRLRGQQLKDPAELDAWANDGSKAHIEALCGFAPSFA